MTNKRNSDTGAPPRTILVVEADGARAKKLRAELERRGFAVSVRRNGSAESAASGRESPSSSSEDGGAANQTLSEEEIGILLWNLTPLETKALSLLLRNAGTTIPRRTLYRRLYGGPGPRESRAVDQLLLRLKDKLGRLGESIETRRGVGVLWNPDPKSTSGFSSRRLLEILRARRAAVLSLLLVAGLAAGWLLRSGRDGEPGAGPVPAAAEIIPPPPPAAEAGQWRPDQSAAPGHGPECSVDGDTNTWYQSAGPARKQDGLVVAYHPSVRGTLSVRCGVPGSTNALPRIRVGVASSDDGSDSRKLGEVDPATGLFSGDIGDKPAFLVFLIVAADSDEPFAVLSVTVEP
jgi:hypothetical protein